MHINDESKSKISALIRLIYYMHLKFRDENNTMHINDSDAVDEYDITVDILTKDWDMADKLWRTAKSPDLINIMVQRLKNGSS